MKRSQISSEFKWDLSSLYPNCEAAIADFPKAYEMLEKLSSQKDTFLQDGDSFLKFINELEAFGRLRANLYVYGKQSNDVEPENNQVQEIFAASGALLNASAEKLSFVHTSMMENADKLREWIKEEKFAAHRFSIESDLHFVDHTRSAEIEQLLAGAGSFGRGASKIYDSIRPSFKPVIIDGKEHFLNRATYQLFLQNEDRDVRRQACENFYEEYKKLETTFAATFETHIRFVTFMSKAAKFNSALEASLYSDNVTKELFEKILHVANVTHRPKLHRFFKLQKKLIGLDDACTYDLNVPPKTEFKLEFSVREGLDLIYEALSPLGEQYIKDLKRNETEHWVDYMTHENKRPGAYSWGTYDSNPYIMMNWVGDLSSVGTLAHEFGHSMHSFYSHKHNEPQNASYRIFVAEVASIVNEVLLNNFLINKYKDNKEVLKKLYFEFLTEIVGTIYRQPFFAKFESDMYSAVESGSPLSTKFIGDTYFEQSKAYYGEDIIVPDFVRYSAYAVPHFYYNFYVYKYTIGMCMALAIGSRILNNDKEQLDRYLNFLKSGGTKWPVDLLIAAGVDPLSDDVYNDAFNYFEQILNSYEELVGDGK